MVHPWTLVRPCAAMHALTSSQARLSAASLLTRLADSDAADADEPGGDRRLRPSPARKDAALDQNDIRALAHALTPALSRKRERGRDSQSPIRSDAASLTRAPEL